MLEQRRLQAIRKNQDLLLKRLKEKHLSNDERQAYLKSLALVTEAVERLARKVEGKRND